MQRSPTCQVSDSTSCSNGHYAHKVGQCTDYCIQTRSFKQHSRLKRSRVTEDSNDLLIKYHVQQIGTTVTIDRSCCHFKTKTDLFSKKYNSFNFLDCYMRRSLIQADSIFNSTNTECTQFIATIFYKNRGSTLE